MSITKQHGCVNRYQLLLQLFVQCTFYSAHIKSITIQRLDQPLNVDQYTRVGIPEFCSHDLCRNNVGIYSYSEATIIRRLNEFDRSTCSTTMMMTTTSQGCIAYLNDLQIYSRPNVISGPRAGTSSACPEWSICIWQARQTDNQTAGRPAFSGCPSCFTLPINRQVFRIPRVASSAASSTRRQSGVR